MPYKEDPKRKHDGTIEYTSRDAHKGLGSSRFLLVYSIRYHGLSYFTMCCIFFKNYLVRMHVVNQ